MAEVFEGVTERASAPVRWPIPGGRALCALVALAGCRSGGASAPPAPAPAPAPLEPPATLFMKASNVAWLGCARRGGPMLDLETCRAAHPGALQIGRPGRPVTTIGPDDAKLCTVPGREGDDTWHGFEIGVWPPERAGELISSRLHLVGSPRDEPPELRELLPQIAREGGGLDPVPADLHGARAMRVIDVDLDGDGKLDRLSILYLTSDSAKLFENAVVANLSSQARPQIVLVERGHIALELEAAIDLNQDGQPEIVFRRTFMRAWGGGLTTYRGGHLVPVGDFLCKGA